MGDAAIIAKGPSSARAHVLALSGRTARHALTMHAKELMPNAGNSCVDSAIVKRNTKITELCERRSPRVCHNSVWVIEVSVHKSVTDQTESEVNYH